MKNVKKLLPYLLVLFIFVTACGESNSSYQTSDSVSLETLPTEMFESNEAVTTEPSNDSLDGSSEQAESSTTISVPEKKTVNNQTESRANKNEKISCNVIVDAGGEYGVLFSGEIEINNGASVFDFLQKTNLPYTGDSSYVSSINGICEKTHGPMSGWMYSVNGIVVMTPCGACTVKSGDTIRWYFYYDE